MISLYLAQDTFVHRLRPGIKLLSLAICATILFMVSAIPIFLLFLLFIALLYRVAKVPFNNVLKQLKTIGLFLILIFVFQVIFKSWLTGFEVVLRLISLVFLASLMSLTTKVSDMVGVIETCLQPFRRFGINPSKFSMVISMAIRFIPVVSEKFNEVREAQRARGFNTNIAALAMPLMIRTIRMASEVAEALDARSYDGDADDKIPNG
ncbi:energy-coupling factor transporter transmembrane component T family protein [Bartonella phoceensis]|uniref:energy-coupling factor transporter transmembrane component T family protein n=1 Tax=Bartonella phoceensis TaxID=270249 RepID=UPI001ABAB470|nr:energy-coupling factor transporter transmembrane protein EcfT [Bartonella phoceensis]